MTQPFCRGLAAGLVLSGLALLGSAGRAEDAIARFAKTEFGLDLARYSPGASVTNFPESIQDGPATNGVAAWRKVPTQRRAPYGTNVAGFAELRFVENRLAEVRTHVGDFLTFSNPGADNLRRLAAFRKLGAKPLASNSSAFYMDTGGWRIRIEGFCSVTNPMLLQFTTSALKRGDPQ